ncbi:hypothetical protein KPL71_017458 [Citrus sinensis]|uniref:Uncharacterized protein n=1 Tax=Citrus sinensis TaxID=2711 RepID=A0ACB8JPX0_CITSI|nr:hypothetical protein KPL71_017458 [Citrus sinensis]
MDLKTSGMILLGGQEVWDLVEVVEEKSHTPNTEVNHALDLPTPHTTSDALMILADTNTVPTIIQIPKQIQKQELLNLMPLEWLTNYEHFHQNSEPVQTTEATFERRQNGQVKLSFQMPETKPVSDTSQLSYTAMITAVQIGQEKKLSIHGFSSEGYSVYPDKINGHFLWDVSEAHMCNLACPCLDDTDVDDELEVMRRKKKKKKKPSSCNYFPPQPPPDPKPPVHPIRSCLMFSSQSYEESFPPLEKQTDTQTRVISKHFVQSLATASGQPEEPKQYEAVLNWQTKNANAQNQTLQQLRKKIDRVANQDCISELDTDLRRMINNHIWGPKFNKKEAEIRKLKAELTRIDAEKTRPSLFPQTQTSPVPPTIFETYAPFYTPSRPQQPVYNQFFGFSHLQPTPQPTTSLPKKSKSKVKISEPKSRPLYLHLFLCSGVRYKQMFLPYIDGLRLYALSETPSPYSHISQKFLEFCPENHSQFHHLTPLWKNDKFFIHLPFKLNEDINPTKASHPSMSPSDLLLAKQECSQLLQLGLIETTDSDWACQAFYVEKRSELVRGKKRLVIDYQPLNSFLKDDKFPLPKIQTLFVHLQGARIFSKFDLKAGFWQLGISPVDRHKTAFCIPDAHYQWTVMPFCLKEHGIMLSEKKSSIAKESITFLGLTMSSLAICEDELWYMWCLTTLPYFQHPETRDFWTQDMAYEQKTYPHPYTLIHDTSVTSVLKSSLMELNNVQPLATNILHTSIGPSHTLEIVPKTQTCTPGSSSSPQGILVMEQCPDYTNVLFQDAQDPWEDFQSLLHTEIPITLSQTQTRDGNGHRPQRVCHYQTQTRTKFKLPNPPATRSGF